MKKISALLLLAAALSLHAADTNAPAAAPDKAAFGKIPDASHAPVRVTNTVSIAGGVLELPSGHANLNLALADSAREHRPVRPVQRTRRLR